MKKVFSSALAIVLTASACLAQATSSISFTNTSPASSAFPDTNQFVNLALGKFNSDLGTLNSVLVTINFVTVGGSFTVERPTSNVTGVVLTNAAAWVTVRESATNSLGYSQVGRVTNWIGASITNVSLPYSISLGSSQLFSIATTNVMVGLSQSINPSFWNSYQSVGGVGSVIFQFQNRPATAYGFTTGTPRLVYSSNFVANANMTVTYNFTPSAPIPEPGTWAVGALLLVGAAYTFWRRRQLTVGESAVAS